MSTWDDKPNDYEHAVAWALEERGKAIRFAAALEQIASEQIIQGMSPALFARKALDNQQTPASGPHPLPPLSERTEFDPKSIGFSLKISEETRREIEEIERNSALAMLNSKTFIFD